MRMRAVTCISALCWLTVAPSACQQPQSKAKWAVTPFEVVAHNNGGSAYGRLAAEAILEELSRTKLFELVPLEAVDRSIKELALKTPVTDQVSLMRLMAEVEAQTIVSGRLTHWSIKRSTATRQADVSITIFQVGMGSLPMEDIKISA